MLIEFTKSCPSVHGVYAVRYTQTGIVGWDPYIDVVIIEHRSCGRLRVKFAPNWAPHQIGLPGCDGDVEASAGNPFKFRPASSGHPETFATVEWAFIMKAGQSPKKGSLLPLSSIPINGHGLTFRDGAPVRIIKREQGGVFPVGEPMLMAWGENDVLNLDVLDPKGQTDA